MRAAGGWETNRRLGRVRRYYPKDLKPRFKQLKAPWTYMSKKEKLTRPFLRPKRWFPKKDYAKVKKLKVFGMTTSNGKCLNMAVPQPWNSASWARMVTSKVGPFLKRSFPGRRKFLILTDGEHLLHAPEAKAAMARAGIEVLKNWPGYSPALNPQENVWSKARACLLSIVCVPIVCVCVRYSSER